MTRRDENGFGPQNFKQSTPLGYLALDSHRRRISLSDGAAMPQAPRRVIPERQRGWQTRWPPASPRTLLPGIKPSSAAQVLPHAHFFNYLTAFGELAIADFLAHGLPGADLVAVRCFLPGEYLSFTGRCRGRRDDGAEPAVHFVALDLRGPASAGRALGLDCLLKKWFPKSRLF